MFGASVRRTIEEMNKILILKQSPVILVGTTNGAVATGSIRRS